MPWDARTFRSRHNKKLTLAQALKASEMANAMMRSGASEGVAIATANKRARNSLADVINTKRD
jgi:Uncharacterized protein conserved in bacteria (DUF2188).